MSEPHGARGEDGVVLTIEAVLEVLGRGGQLVKHYDGSTYRYWLLSATDAEEMPEQLDVLVVTALRNRRYLRELHTVHNNRRSWSYYGLGAKGRAVHEAQRGVGQQQASGEEGR